MCARCMNMRYTRNHVYTCMNTTLSVLREPSDRRSEQPNGYQGNAIHITAKNKQRTATHRTAKKTKATNSNATESSAKQREATGLSLEPRETLGRKAKQINASTNGRQTRAK